ncbi:MAG: hypothetical protein FWB91_00135 [Defluviitaleaceae bacterium]|nr:hypothetical protein [Defluviitaleaceae bacterium]
MFSGNVMMLPGQELRGFTVYAPETRGTDNGREGLVNQYVPLGNIKAILAQARPEETQRWRQLNHPVSHKIIMQHRPPFTVLPGCMFERTDTGQRYYVAPIPYDPGDISHWNIFYCNDRRDVSN